MNINSSIARTQENVSRSLRTVCHIVRSIYYHMYIKCIGLFSGRGRKKKQVLIKSNKINISEKKIISFTVFNTSHQIMKQYLGSGTLEIASQKSKNALEQTIQIFDLISFYCGGALKQNFKLTQLLRCIHPFHLRPVP